jgi:hypothetical protein
MPSNSALVRALAGLLTRLLTLLRLALVVLFHENLQKIAET